MTYATQPLLTGLMFPEGPRWHDQRLWFTDQHARKIIAVSLNGEAETIAEMDDLPGGLGWLPDGSLLVVSMTRRQVLVMRNGRLFPYADLHGLAPFHCNDMLADRAGRIYVGNFGYDLHGGENIKPTCLILIDVDGTSHAIADELVFPNGMALGAQGNILFVAETFASRITAFDVDAQGRLHNRRIFALLGEGYPDGICLDEQNRLWVACPNLGEVLRLDVQGAIDLRIRTRGAPYACMLGADDYRTLLICTSETDDPQRARAMRSGRIEVVRVGD